MRLPKYRKVLRYASAGVACCMKSFFPKAPNDRNGMVACIRSRSPHVITSVLEDANGRRFWVYREGLYGREPGVPRWFLQGSFRMSAPMPKSR